MTKVIVYQRLDSGVSVINPNWSAQLPDEGEADFLERIRVGAMYPKRFDGESIEDYAVREKAEKTMPFRVCDRSELPVYNSATRNRWIWQNGKVVIDPKLA